MTWYTSEDVYFMIFYRTFSLELAESRATVALTIWYKCVSIAASYAHNIVSYDFLMIDTWPNAVGTARIDFAECERQSSKIGDTQSSALRQRKDLLSDIGLSKILKYCYHMYVSYLGGSSVYLQVPEGSTWRLSAIKYSEHISVLPSSHSKEKHTSSDTILLPTSLVRPLTSSYVITCVYMTPRSLF